MDSGVATRPIADFDAYIEAQRVRLQNEPVYEADFLAGAQRAEAGGAGGRRRYPRTARDSGAGLPWLAKPILIGRPGVIEMRIQKLGLQIKAGVDFEIVNNESDPRFKEYWNEYYT